MHHARISLAFSILFLLSDLAKRPFASVAQLVEQGTENPRVVGSIPTGGTIVGVFNAEGTPVPIPNTEVKLCSGENTWLETTRENS